MYSKGLKKYSFIVPDILPNIMAQQEASLRLDHFLYQSLSDFIKIEIKNNPPIITKSLVRKCIIAGAVYLNNKRVKIASKGLKPQARIDIYLDIKKIKNKTFFKHENFEITDSHILYRDDFLLAVNKPAGLPTQPTLDDARENLFEAVKKYLFKNSKGQPIYCGLHHRLDRDTSGVVVFTLKKEINPFFANIFKEKKIHKTYQALSYQNIKTPVNVSKNWIIRNFLGEKPGPGKRKIYTSVRSGGKGAETHFTLLKQLHNKFWIEAKPITGRTHQIRVHLSEMGLPIFGEFVYAPLEREPCKSPRLMLHAQSIEFQDYKDKNKTIKINAPLPEDFCSFKKQLGL